MLGRPCLAAFGTQSFYCVFQSFPNTLWQFYQKLHTDELYCVCCQVLASCSSSWQSSEEWRVWPGWVSITHKGALMWSRWRGQVMHEKGGGGGRWGRRGETAEACSSRWADSLRSSAEPEGVGLNHSVPLAFLRPAWRSCANANHPETASVSHLISPSSVAHIYSHWRWS